MSSCLGIIFFHYHFVLFYSINIGSYLDGDIGISITRGEILAEAHIIHWLTLGNYHVGYCQ